MTEETTASQTSTRRRSRIRFREILAAYPAVFRPPYKPLRIGIHEDLEQLHGPKVKYFLARHANSPAYLKAIVAGGPRCRLDGTPDGEVSEEERQNALAKLQKLAEEKEATWRRARMLKEIEAAGQSAADFAAAHGLSAEATQIDYEKALAERAARRQWRAEVVGAFEASGLTAEEFARQRRITVARLRRIVEKVRLQQSGGSPAAAPSG
ncbi:MAG TPA: ProQ/FINO family protein [Burkholderiaceae bacterium]|nr:ProQ/FINO family protein [Burkholderiaceae bacterium]